MKTKPLLVRLFLLLALASLFTACVDTGFYRKEVSLSRRVLEAPPWWDKESGNPLNTPGAPDYEKNVRRLHRENLGKIVGIPTYDAWNEMMETMAETRLTDEQYQEFISH